MKRDAGQKMHGFKRKPSLWMKRSKVVSITRNKCRNSVIYILIYIKIQGIYSIYILRYKVNLTNY
jgi:hypothetical protein